MVYPVVPVVFSIFMYILYVLLVNGGPWLLDLVPQRDR